LKQKLGKRNTYTPTNTSKIEKVEKLFKMNTWQFIPSLKEGSSCQKKNKLVKCRMCGKLTHSDIDGCGGLDLCRPCRLLAEAENEHNDYHDIYNPVKGCKWCEKKTV
jgi:hypothetical protein